MITKEDFQTPEAAKAVRLVDYVEGKQLNYLIRALDGKNDGGIGRRYNWRKRGFMPTVRNITTPIVEKSAGNLFIKPLRYNILPETAVTAEPVVDARLMEIFNASDFQEHLQNINIYSRLLRSICILFQKYIPQPRLSTNGQYSFDASSGDALLPTILHQGNSVVRLNPQRTQVVELAYLTHGCPTDPKWEYRYINSEYIIDYVVENDVEIAGAPIPNPEGIVPAVMHYDTKKPATGVWAPLPDDIRTTQEAYNVHFTDLNFAIAQNVGKPLYTNTKFKKPGESDVQATVVGKIGENTLPRIDDPNNNDGFGGIGSIIQIDAKKDIPAFVEHRGPDVDLQAQHAVLESMIHSLATDWSVNLKVAGNGAANSGFQLVVEEMDNLNLQQQRMLSFKGTFRRMYDILQMLYPELTSGIMEVEFNPVALPVNQKEQEEVWKMKIDNGRASVVDYLMTTEGLSRQEAIARKLQIDADQALFAPKPVAVTVSPTSNTTDTEDNQEDDSEDNAEDNEDNSDVMDE